MRGKDSVKRVFRDKWNFIIKQFNLEELTTSNKNINFVII